MGGNSRADDDRRGVGSRFHHLGAVVVVGMNPTTILERLDIT